MGNAGKRGVSACRRDGRGEALCRFDRPNLPYYNLNRVDFQPGIRGGAKKNFFAKFLRSASLALARGDAGRRLKRSARGADDFGSGADGRRDVLDGRRIGGERGRGVDGEERVEILKRRGGLRDLVERRNFQKVVLRRLESRGALGRRGVLRVLGDLSGRRDFQEVVLRRLEGWRVLGRREGLRVLGDLVGRGGGESGDRLSVGRDRFDASAGEHAHFGARRVGKGRDGLNVRSGRRVDGVKTARTDRNVIVGVCAGRDRGRLRKGSGGGGGGRRRLGGDLRGRGAEIDRFRFEVGRLFERFVGDFARIVENRGADVENEGGVRARAFDFQFLRQNDAGRFEVNGTLATDGNDRFAAWSLNVLAQNRGGFRFEVKTFKVNAVRASLFRRYQKRAVFLTRRAVDEFVVF